MFQAAAAVHLLHCAIWNKSPTTTHPWNIVLVHYQHSHGTVQRLFCKLVEGYERTNSLSTSFNTLWSRALDPCESKYKAFSHFGMITTKIQWPFVLCANMIGFFLAYFCKAFVTYPTT
jgi:hypothetical protein